MKFVSIHFKGFEIACYSSCEGKPFNGLLDEIG
jgi:hypothetical protein